MAGVAELVSEQNRDGGWGWFHDNISDPFFTAYVLYYLASARELGFVVPQKVLKQAVEFLTTSLTAKSTSEFIRAEAGSFDAFCAYLFYFMAHAAVSSRNPSLMSAVEGFVPIVRGYLQHADDPTALACAVLGLATLNKENNSKILHAAVRLLASMAEKEGFWRPRTIRPAGGSLETTALALRALLCVSPTTFGDLLRKGLRWMQKKVEGGFCYNTRATAAAVTTIAAATNLPKPKTGPVTIRLNGKVVAKVRMKKESALVDALRLRLIDASQLLRNGENTLLVEAPGEPSVCVTLKRWPRDPKQRLSITRTYSRNRFSVGSTSHVSLTICAPTPMEWAVLEEPLPANCAPSTELLNLERERGVIADFALIGGKLYIYLRKVEGTLRLTYGLEGRRAGSVTQAAPKVCDMYDETRFAVGTPTRVEVHR